jgi:hypothetical protein
MVAEKSVKLLIKDLRDAVRRLAVLLDEICVVVLDHEQRLQELEEHG